MKNSDPVSEKKREIRGLFDSIVPSYDFLNGFLSLGIDRLWRRTTVKSLGDINGRKVLDICCGTGALSKKIIKKGADLYALDFSFNMLIKGRINGDIGTGPVAADASFLPYKDNTFYRETIAFGIRNIPDFTKFLTETHRTLMPGGVLAILELTRPAGRFIRAIYYIYLKGVLPVIGGFVSGRPAAYRYLADTISRFVDPVVLKEELINAGYSGVVIRPLSFGIATLIICVKSNKD